MTLLWMAVILVLIGLLVAVVMAKWLWDANFEAQTLDFAVFVAFLAIGFIAFGILSAIAYLILL